MPATEDTAGFGWPCRHRSRVQPNRVPFRRPWRERRRHTNSSKWSEPCRSWRCGVWRQGTLRRPLFKSGVLSGCPGTRTRSVESKRASSSFWAGVASPSGIGTPRRRIRRTRFRCGSLPAAARSEIPIPIPCPVGGFSIAAHKCWRHRELRVCDTSSLGVSRLCLL
jgi:hypothetical protein